MEPLGLELIDDRKRVNGKRPQGPEQITQSRVKLDGPRRLGDGQI